MVLIRHSNLLPVVHPDTRILILGSMPSQQSLHKQQYYGHPQNQFWRILAGVFAVDVPEDYEGRLACLRRLRVGVWDVIASCRREGSSLDADIKDARINAFDDFLLQYKHLNVIGCNGGLAYQLFIKNVTTDLTVVRLPSSSPAHTVPLARKIAAWKHALT